MSRVSQVRMALVGAGSMGTVYRRSGEHARDRSRGCCRPGHRTGREPCQCWRRIAGSGRAGGSASQPNPARAMFTVAGFDTIGFRRASERPQMIGASRALYGTVQGLAVAVGGGKDRHVDGVPDPAPRLTPRPEELVTSAMARAAPPHLLTRLARNSVRIRVQLQWAFAVARITHRERPPAATGPLRGDG